MTAQEEFQAYKTDYEKKLVKRARTQAVVLGLSTVVAVLALLYGTIQSIEAGAQRDLAIKNYQDAIAAKIEVDKQRAIANDLLHQNDDLKTQLEACSAPNVKNAQQTCGKALAEAETMVQANLERAVKAEESAYRTQKLNVANAKKAEQITTDLKKQLEKCKSGK